MAPRSLGWVRISANSRTPSRGERGGVEVLDDEDAVLHVQDLGHLERAVGVLGGHGAVAPGVAAGERDAALDQPVGELAAGAGLAREIGVGVVPVRAPAGVEQHGVAGLGLDAREVVEADHVARPEASRRGRGDVDEPAAGDDLRDGLDAEPVHAAVLGELARPSSRCSRGRRSAGG